MITFDASPLLLFTKIFQVALQRRKRLFKLGNLGFELTSVESDFCATGTGKTLVRLYPSDVFLRFATTVFARDFDLGLVEDSSHEYSIMPNVEVNRRAATLVRVEPPVRRQRARLRRICLLYTSPSPRDS